MLQRMEKLSDLGVALPELPAGIVSREQTQPVPRSRTREPLARAEWFFIGGFWGFIALLTFISAGVNMVSPPHPPPQSPLVAASVAALIDCVMWALLTPLLFGLTRRFNLERPRWVFSLLLLLALGVAIALGVSMIMAYVRYVQAANYFQSIAGQPDIEFDPAWLIQRFFIVNEFLIYVVIMAAGYAYDHFVRYRARQEEASALQAQAAHLRAELADARLNALRTQLNPHFLFNTLNGVSCLVEQNPRGAQRMIARLSDLLRDTLDGTELEVPLERELAFVRRYIEIMRMRFQDRLEAIENVAPDTLHALVPNLILQPLVENAIKHGVEKFNRVGRIEIRAQRDGDSLRLSVLDNGSADSATRLQDPHGAGLGLKNTQARLLQSYGDRQSLRLRVCPEGGVMAEIFLPFHTRGNSR